MLIVSALGISATLFIYGALTFFQKHDFVSGKSWLPLSVFIIYIGFFMVNQELKLFLKKSTQIKHYNFLFRMDLAVFRGLFLLKYFLQKSVRQPILLESASPGFLIL